MNIEDLEYLKQTFEFIRKNTELVDYNRDIETYGNNMMNCDNIISRAISERKKNTDCSLKLLTFYTFNSINNEQ